MRNVLVTGAARGIGLACAQAFAAAKWNVYGVDQADPVDPSLFFNFIKADLATETGLHKVFDIALNITELDALVNNAALQIIKPLIETSCEEIDNVMNLNFKVPLQLAQTFFPHMRHRGAIVNISSVHALATSEHIGLYAASKAGLLSLTRTMAIEFGKEGVRANALLPGAVDTDMLKAGLCRGYENDFSPDDQMKQMISRHPIGRIGLPADVANAVFFLADSIQSGFITGQALIVDGGCLARLSTE